MRSDVGIAVHVAANPGSEPEDDVLEKAFRAVAVVFFIRCLEGFVIHRGYPVQDIGEVKKYVVEFIRYRGPRMRHQTRLPG